MAMLNRSASICPRGPSRRLAAASAASLALCGGALVLAPSAPATFPGKNGKIAFLHKERGGLPDIYTMRSDGSHERRLAPGWSPAFSPSGRKVLFSPRGISNHLYTIRVDGTHLRRIRHTRRSADGSFAPGGKKIVLERYSRQYEPRGLYTMRVDGSHRKRIGRFGGDGQFSPNGRWIVFVGRSCDICLIRPNGTGLRSLTDNSARPWVADYAPDFSPNGRRVVFTRVTDNDVDAVRTGVYTIRLGGARLRRVYEVPANRASVGDAVYSPDGRRIAFSRRAGGLPHIYTIRPDGSNLRRLSHGRDGHEQLSWGVRR